MRNFIFFRIPCTLNLNSSLKGVKVSFDWSRQMQGIWNHFFSEWRMFTWSCAGFYQGVTEQDKMWSWLSAHFKPFFSAHSAYFDISRQKITYSNVLHQNSVVCDCFAKNNFASCNYLGYFETLPRKIRFVLSLWIILWIECKGALRYSVIQEW